MKKTYESPSIEKVAFKYRDQVVVASNSGACTQKYQNNTGALGSDCFIDEYTGDKTYH